MKELEIDKAFSLIEPGPVVMVTTTDKGKSNIMTISWHMVMDFTPRFAILTGPWNYSYHGLISSGECVISIPTIELLDKVIGIGTTSGAEVDKFARFGFTPQQADMVSAPLIKECYANIECTVADHIGEYDIFVLEARKAWITKKSGKKRIFHYRGDGTFVADGETFHRKEKMREKLAPGFSKK